MDHRERRRAARVEQGSVGELREDPSDLDGGDEEAQRNVTEATMASRVLWKGAISFGLVHIPVALHAATRESGLDFDWLDKRTMDPVGYKRINKKTGKEIERDNIVKGIKVGEGHYAVLTNEEIAAAY